MHTLHVISFPKSGRTWLRVMLDDVGLRAIFSHDGSDHVHRRSLTDLDPDKSRYSSESVLLMVRDPRDTVVSGYFQVTRRLRIDARSISEILRDDRHGIQKICHFNLQWFAAGHRINRFAILTYEQMHKSPMAALSAVTRFSGMVLEERIAGLIASNRTFERMRAAESSGAFARRYGEILLPRNQNDKESFKLRRGVVGGYPEYLSEVDLAYCQDILTKTDYWPHFRQAMSRWDVEQIQLPGRRLPCAGNEDAVL